MLPLPDSENYEITIYDYAIVDTEAEVIPFLKRCWVSGEAPIDFEVTGLKQDFGSLTPEGRVDLRISFWDFRVLRLKSTWFARRNRFWSDCNRVCPFRGKPVPPDSVESAFHFDFRPRLI